MESKKNIALEIENYFDRLWSICRSITGNGVRESINILKEIIPFNIQEVESGTSVFDWIVPKEWNIRDAYIITPEGKKICDFKKNNLHVVGYSIPVNREMTFSELKNHLHVLPRLPEAIPYVTSYYNENWGFCLSQNEFLQLPEIGNYNVVIDATLEKGTLTFADCILEGERKEEIVFSTYCCHPSLANNELSGPLTMAFLYRELAKKKDRKYTYRFIIAPETIGALVYLKLNGVHLKENTKAGFIFTCCGLNAPYVFKKSRNEESLTNKATIKILQQSGVDYRVDEFDPIGSDERQYCSPGFNLPMGSLMRGKYWEYPEYHTSLDNKDIISFSSMAEVVEMHLKIIDEIERHSFYTNTILTGEPNLGKRNLYKNLSGENTMPEVLTRRMRLLNFMDGNMSIEEFAEKFNYDISVLNEEVNVLVKAGLLK